ncbi:hypothetical protein BHE74_00028930 [Ensete ventricosum]|nr:hypothetical protein BHE74_00028930 [Ensete ventricosum]
MKSLAKKGGFPKGAYLFGERTRGCELVTDEIAGGDVGHAEEPREAARVGPLPDARAAQEHPLHVPAPGIPPRRHPLSGQARRERETRLRCHRRDPPHRHARIDGGVSTQQAAQGRHLAGEERRPLRSPFDCSVCGGFGTKAAKIWRLRRKARWRKQRSRTRTTVTQASTREKGIGHVGIG